jgi:DNA-binding NarL/FixJ family response regulator
MKRLLIIGSDAFTAQAMGLALRLTAGVSLHGVVDRNGAITDAVRQAKPDLVVIDGLADVEHALACLSQVREHARDALSLMVVRRLASDDAARALRDGAVICLWVDSAAASVNAAAAAAAPASAPPAPVSAEPAAPPLRVAETPVDERPPMANRLTSRELETLSWVAQGYTNGWTARKLWVTEQTVKFHLTNIYRKLGVANRTEASHYAMVNGLVSPGDRVAPPAGDPDATRAA